MANKAEDIIKWYEKLSPEGKERYLCSIDPWYFLTKYVKTVDPYEGVRDFPTYDYLKHTAYALQDHRMNIFRKGRQLTFSWFFVAWGIWESQFKFGSTCLYTSKRQEDSFELKERAYFIWEHLPEWLRMPLTEDNKSTMAFRRQRSRLKFLPATDNIGRTFTAGHVFMDEFAHVTCNAGKMYTSIKPTINAGGSCTVFSSPNGPYGKFYDLCDGADGPDEGWGIELKNGFFYHYMPYNVHPEHDAKWEEGAFRGLTKEEIDQEYRALWIKRGGRVYPGYDPSVHLIDDFIIPDHFLRVRAIDFGGANPTAVIWVAFDPKNGRAYVYRDYKQNGLPIKQHAKHVKQVSGDEQYRLGTISDHDSQSRIEWRDCGIETSPAIKDWDSGYNEVTRYLMAGDDGKPGLFIFKSCISTHQEISTYSWKEVDESKRDKPENPLQLNDHLMDALRYVMRTTKGRRAGFVPVTKAEGNSMVTNIDQRLGIINPVPVQRSLGSLVPRLGLLPGMSGKLAGSSIPLRRLHI